MKNNIAIILIMTFWVWVTFFTEVFFVPRERCLEIRKGMVGLVPAEICTKKKD